MAEGDHTPRVLVSDRQDAPVDLEALLVVAREAMVGEGVALAELSLSLVTEAEMAELHERFMGEPGPTDVLSFPLDDDDRDEDGVRILGDVVIAPSVAARNNPEDAGAELRLLVVHGILHLLGHDHDDPAGKAEMWARQSRYAEAQVP